MHTIIVVGHPHSDLGAVEGVLHGYGMLEPKVSRIQKLSPREIGQYLLKESGEGAANGPWLEQLSPGELWNGLALDLFLANSEAHTWGWSDPQAIRLLEYWKKADSKIRFALVYSSPEAAFVDVFAGQVPTAGELNSFVLDWCEYNAALLHFYHRNSANCYLTSVDALIGAPDCNTDAFAVKLGIEFVPVNSAMRAEAVSIVSNRIDLYLAKNLLKDFPKAAALYAELQATADLPSQSEEMPCALAIWEEHIELIRKTLVASLALEDAKSSLKDKSDLLQQAELKIGHLENQARKAPEISNKSIEQENQLLLTQLHLVQEELERHYLASKNASISIPKTLQVPGKNAKKEQSGRYGAAARVKKQLSYRLGATLIAHSGSISGWLKMPFALVRQVREFESDKKAVTQKLPPISTYRDAHDAERVRQHLSYRLGAAMLANSRSPIGWLKMPFAMRRELNAFKGSRQGK